MYILNILLPDNKRKCAGVDAESGPGKAEDNPDAGCMAADHGRSASRHVEIHATRIGSGTGYAEAGIALSRTTAAQDKERSNPLNWPTEDRRNVVKTFDMPLLKIKDLPARYPLNCESRVREPELAGRPGAGIPNSGIRQASLGWRCACMITLRDS